MLNAKEARLLAEKNSQNGFTLALQNAEDAINERIKLGCFSCSFVYLRTDVIKALEELGYTIKFHAATNMTDSYYIVSW